MAKSTSISKQKLTGTVVVFYLKELKLPDEKRGCKIVSNLLITPFDSLTGNEWETNWVQK